jgi:redox-sensitive bicupin YhaK (pirin superfamily)
LWLNLDKKNKFCNPRYQEYDSSQIPVFKDEGMTAKVIAGEVLGVKGPIEAIVPTYFIDFYFQKEKEYEHVIPKGWNSMMICHRGKFSI